MTADRFAPERLTSAEGAARSFDVEETRALVRPLYEGKALRTGESFAAHADGIAAIVSTMRPDPDLLVAAQLFGVHDVLRDPDEWLRSRFGPVVAQLVSDLRQLMRLSELTRAREEAKGRSHAEEQPEALRRMLLAMTNDLRVVLLRLASRLQTLRFYAVNRRPGAEPFARETRDRYAPLANGLGIGSWWELRTCHSVFPPDPETTGRWRACSTSATASSASLSSTRRYRWLRQRVDDAACVPKSAAARSTSTASGTRCARKDSPSKRSTTCAVFV
jgi:hypothetical protein